ncbi:glycine cleavage system aminomethyltransferase GcvT [Marivibrio halodurans]|uniref:aminomethyltransferase n=1 Tax=Marivibrio halodurans TaxID=2039722 RepID=A0A8J7S7K7_9PROT|nr:glycine cleavage system aminomethyltransferase GcvT [Marivibrio halodurans]MBP5858294.1 glycine cleavage system aminomethyltransferase GcvT [Marivibrio halodurans]
MAESSSDTTGMSADGDLSRTPLHALHLELGAKMVPFAGYDMPVQYPMGVLKEHQHCRAAAGLFDVSHMGQAWLVAEAGEDPAAPLEMLVPAEIQALKPGRQRYTQFTNGAGGILDDLMVTRPVGELGADRLYLVVNAACKEADFAYMSEKLAGRARLERLDDRALIAVQGPEAAAAVAHVFDDRDLTTAPFMSQSLGRFAGEVCWLSRSGYTGEDGFEISMPTAIAEELTRALLAVEAVAPIGLGARDSLRLEAGLCLYGHDIDTGTTPVEAGLVWSIGKRRRGEGGFPGAETIQAQIADGAPRRRVGIRPDGRAPAREGVEISSESGEGIGTITSGGFGPSFGGPVAMGYVRADHAEPGTAVRLTVRGKAQPATVVALPFVPANFYRG